MVLLCSLPEAFDTLIQIGTEGKYHARRVLVSDEFRRMDAIERGYGVIRERERSEEIWEEPDLREKPISILNAALRLYKELSY